MIRGNTEKCPVCGSTNASRVYHSSSHWGGLSPNMQFCEDCGCVYVDKYVRESAKRIRRNEEERATQAQRVEEEIQRKVKSFCQDRSGDCVEENTSDGE